MTRNGLSVARPRILPQSVFLALSSQHTAVLPKMAEETFTLDPIDLIETSS